MVGIAATMLFNREDEDVFIFPSQNLKRLLRLQKNERYSITQNFHAQKTNLGFNVWTRQRPKPSPQTQPARQHFPAWTASAGKWNL